MGYALMGSVCLSVMVSLGEMIALFPIPGGHIRLAGQYLVLRSPPSMLTLSGRFVDPALSFAMGWNYVYNWIIIMPAELSAAAALINFWNKSINNALWISICFAVVVAINFMGAGVYGEAEFWFASIKVLTIVGLIILGIIISAGGGPEGQVIGFKYWRDPGPFTQYSDIPGALGRFLGFWAVLTQAAFSFIGTEIVAIAAGEAKNPRVTLPSSIKKVYIRILLFYLGGTFIIGMIVPSNSPSIKLNSGTLASPFVIAIKQAGIPALPAIINACLLTSAWSAASSDLFTSSRALYGLAITHKAPMIFARTTKSGLPWVALLTCSLFGSLAYMSLQTSAGKAFGYLANLTAACGLLTWWGICLTFIRFYSGLKTQGIDRSTLPYYSRLNTGAFAAWYGIILISIILFFSSYTVFLKDQWDTPTFVTNYLPIFTFPVLWIGWKLLKRTKFVRAHEMDFVSGLDEIEADCAGDEEDTKPKNLWEKVWAKII